MKLNNISTRGAMITYAPNSRVNILKMAEGDDKKSDNWDEKNWLNQGIVVRLADGIATVEGLSKVTFGELVGIRVKAGMYEEERFGIVLDLDVSTAGVAILANSMEGIEEGSTVSRKGRCADVPTGYWALGRVLDALGQPIDKPETSPKEERLPPRSILLEDFDKAPHDDEDSSGLCFSKKIARTLHAQSAGCADRQPGANHLRPATTKHPNFTFVSPETYSVSRPIEQRSPSILERQPVSEPLCTGITTIDALIPVGRGQRELIIGDRKTGKTSIAIDAVIQQSKILKSYATEPDADCPYRRSPGVYCVYTAIGQKASSVAATTRKLDLSEAMGNTVILSSAASASAVMKYLAPYSATALAEHFMYEGDAVLIIYDDLTRQAEAYREISLLLRRPPGREAYPGDIFYIHSRLLERSAKLAPELDSGSITAFPIIETLEGDVSAYLPTNVISITDGQIFLSAARFNAGFLPAINIGISVSRVGSSSQTKLLKTVVGSTKLGLAQYEELQSFAKFSSELDKGTRAKIRRGVVLEEILKQDEASPLSTEEQMILLRAANSGCLDDLTLEETKKYKSLVRLGGLKRVGTKNSLPPQSQLPIVETIADTLNALCQANCANDVETGLRELDAIVAQILASVAASDS